MAPDTRTSIPYKFCGVRSPISWDQNEAHSDPDVPFASYELRTVQEDGDLREYACYALVFRSLSLSILCSAQNQPRNVK